MKTYRLMLGVAGLLVCILPVSAQTPAPRGSDATEPPISSSKEGISDTQTEDAQSTASHGESTPNATGPGGIEIPTDATADGSRGLLSVLTTVARLNSRAPSNAR